MKIRQNYFAAVLIAMLFVFFSCGEKKQSRPLSYPLETAKMVSQVTSGLVSSSGEIQVVFVAEMVDKEQVGLNLSKKVFSFEPVIEGETRWHNRRTLIFKPSQKLPFKQSYSGSLDLNTLFPQHKEKQLELLPIEFMVAGREVQHFEAELKLVREDDPAQLVLSGLVRFTETASLNTIKEAAALDFSGKNTALNWTADNDKRSFTFKSEPLLRPQKDKELTLLIRKNDLQISDDYRRTYKVPALKEFKVVDLFVDSDGRQPQLKVEFSDDLKAYQDLSGFISVEPPMDIKLKAIDRQVLVRGNFEHGKSYTIFVQPGIRSRWASSTEKVFRETVDFEDMLPEIRFANDGVFLPSTNQKKVLFQSVNVSRVVVKVIKVFDSNLGQFLQMERLNGEKTRRDRFSYNVDRVGVDVARSELLIGDQRNRWLQHELDLQKLIDPSEKGLFLVSIEFERKDMLYDTSENNLQYRRRRNDYYNDPASYGYLYSHGRIYKPLIVSDIGVTSKQGLGSYWVFTTDLVDARPLSGVKIQLKTYQNQVIAEGYSDGRGMAEFSNIEDDVFFIEAEKGGQRSAVKPGEMAWNLSTFDTRGVDANEQGLRAYIYSERGVYRPGDAVNLCAIIRNAQNTFPDNHPVSLTISNPKNQTVFEQTVKEAQDGFYHFKYQGSVDDLTGNYLAKIKAGSQIFFHDVKIETVVPERLKVQLESSKKRLDSNDRRLKVELQSTYLFGNPAKGLRAEVELTLSSRRKTFQKYADFSFWNESVKYKTQTISIFDGKLDVNGRAVINRVVPPFNGVPAVIDGRMKAKVFEKGGRSSQAVLNIEIDPYPYYVGLQKPDMKYGYARTGQELDIPVVLLTPDGIEKPGRTLHYRIYKNQRHWWWEYDTRDQYRMRYKKDNSTELLKEGELVSGGTPVTLSFTPEERGQYLIEVQDGNENGHTAAFFISAYPWGEAPATGKDAAVLALKADKEKYYPGETATISFPVPGEAAVLLTIEKGSSVLSSAWHYNNGQGDEMKLTIPINKEMLPTVYASVSVIQPHAQTINDRPMRNYGMIPLNVEDSNTRQELSINMSESLESGKFFDVEIQTTDGRPAQLTVAVVDEGLLSLTRFKTPDPWKSFFSKLRLGVMTADMFSQVIGVNKGDIFKTFSIGGGMAEDAYRKGQMEEQKARRFKAVAMFKGPLQTDARGRLKLSFEMPEYIGAVRVMAASANKNRYGSAEKTVAVKTDLMVLPTLPRVIGPNDKFFVPVTVFAMTDNLGTVSVSLDLDGPLGMVGPSSKTVKFEESGERDVMFEIQAKAAVGIAQINIRANAASAQVKSSTEIAVRASSPRISESSQKTLEKGETITFTVPDKGLPGSNQASISVHRRPNLKLGRRILWLIRYPYGCIEQTVSAVFPQLYLREFIPKSRMAKRDIDKNINAAISRLRSFQLGSGGFSYWPGNRRASEWGSLYAGHFMVEAKKLGYNIPPDLFDNWLRFQKAQSRVSKQGLMVQTYRAYVLAMAGEAGIGAMNLLKENKLSEMNDTQRWLLASAYKLAGVEKTANRILTSTKTRVEDYEEFAGTYGSALRDKAMILDQMTLFERWGEANKLAAEISTVLSSSEWYSTQTSGFMLLALGKYFKALEGEGDKKILSGTVRLPSGREEKFNTETISFNVDIESGFGEQVSVVLDQNSTVERAFATLDWSGRPMEYLGRDESQNLTLSVEWLDDDGMLIDPSALSQGNSFWAHFQVKKPATYRHKIEELALVQVLPPGWEIENTRLSAEQKPQWMRSWRTGREEYMDIRDDRVMWFFDMDAYEKGLDFVVKINTVTAGRFLLPPTMLEAMYNNNYRAMKAGKKVRVNKR